MASKEENSAIAEIKNWLFPGTVTIIGIFAGVMLKDIKEDLAEVKADVKALMVQSSIDKTRIDNLERQLYKSSASYPTLPPMTREVMEHVAVLPEKLTIKQTKHEKVFF
jgi:hypothetical protein